jgi:PhoH-like ATPase
MNLPKAIVIDTNVLIHDPESIEILMNDINILFLHTSVIQELDKLKTQRDIGRDCREAIRKIEKLHIENHPRLRIIQRSDWNNPKLDHLDKSKNDHHIIALAYNLMNQYSSIYKEVKLISKDVAVRILARDLGIIVEDYISESIKIDDTSLKEVEVPIDSISLVNGDYIFRLPDMSKFINNEGVICWSDWNGWYPVQLNSEWRQNFVAIKKGDNFQVVPKDISMMGIIPYVMNGYEKNWEQYVAMAHLMDDDIKCSFLIGGSGSGKTLLALAAVLEQRKKFRNIMITRPMVHLEDEDRMGFLPGGPDEKMAPWLRPIYRTISYISSMSEDNKKIIERIKDNNKIEIEPLDYIRGMTFVKDILLVDEAQNLTPHQMKTIITRIGENSKIIFTGDLGQIDRIKKINAETSGLAYASVKMAGEEEVSTVYFKKTVRSKLAEKAERLL